MSSEKKQGPGRRRRYAVAAGAVVSSISLASGGAAVAAGLGGPDGQGPAGAKVQSAAAQTPAKPAKADPTQRALDAYFKAGYDFTDAETLARLWHESPYKAKIQAGNKLLAGGSLPIKHHGGGGGPSARQTRELNAFFGAGYTYGDAVKLAALWHTSDPYHAKLRAGGKLLAGGTLPFPPH